MKLPPVTVMYWNALIIAGAWLAWGPRVCGYVLLVMALAMFALASTDKEGPHGPA